MPVSHFYQYYWAVKILLIDLTFLLLNSFSCRNAILCQNIYSPVLCLIDKIS